MFYRKDAGVALAVLSLLASAGFAMAETKVETPKLSLESSVLNLEDAAPKGLLMQGLEKVGVTETYGINLYGWVQAGYTYNVRNHDVPAGQQKVYPGTFNHEAKNNIMLNQVSLIAERLVDTSGDKFDIGGKVWVLYGTDANVINATGMEIYRGMDAYSPQYQFEFVEAYVDIAPGIEGLTIRAGKFATPVGYEYINPTINAFYSHTWLYSLQPFTHVGAHAIYTVNEQWTVAGGVIRGWDDALEDKNDVISGWAQVAYTPNKQWSYYLTAMVGPENAGDNDHYRTTLNPIVVYKATDALSFGFEGMYVYDGGINGGGYGDIYGGAGYVGYVINEMFTANARAEATHTYTNGNNITYYSLTLGVTITPLPKDPIGSNLKLRPEVRYDFSTDNVFLTESQAFQDQWTIGGDVIFTF